MLALTQRASSLRNGLPCSIAQGLQYDISRSAVIGNMNYHIEIVFGDGISWLADIYVELKAFPFPVMGLFRLA